MIVVTGSAGFVGRNLILELNRMRVTPVLAVDVPTDMSKLKNMDGLVIAGYMGKDEFLKRIEYDADFADSVTAVFHEGACSSTVEKDEDYLQENNTEFTIRLLHACSMREILVQYASTAGVYGANHASKEVRENEAPLTPYARSKLVIDEFVRQAVEKTPLDEDHAIIPIVGLRYFNVYGPGENHKGYMRSTPLVFYEQVVKTGKIKIFGEHGGFGPGEHRRDFIYIDDLVKLKAWCLQNCSKPLLMNAGTGVSHTFNEVAAAVIKFHGSGTIEYISFPEELKESYQCNTQADLETLRTIGYKEKFTPMEEGVQKYLTHLKKMGF